MHEKDDDHSGRRGKSWQDWLALSHRYDSSVSCFASSPRGEDPIPVLASCYRVFQQANPVNTDLHYIATGQGKTVAGNNACACHEKNTLWECVVPEKILHQMFRFSFQFRERCTARISGPPLTQNFKLDGSRFCQRSV